MVLQIRRGVLSLTELFSDTSSSRNSGPDPRREWPQQNRVDNVENGAIGSDAERKDGDYDGRESPVVKVL
jgi:hypothetical protein